MKNFFTIALSCLALTAVAQPKIMKSVSGMPNNVKQSATPIMRFDTKAPMSMVKMSGKMDKACTLSMDNAVSTLHRAPASAADGVLYRPSSHNLKAGLFYYEDANTFGYNYNTPYLFSQAYQGTYDVVSGNSWTIGESDTAAESEWIVNRNFSMAAAGMGVGGFYTPKIWNKRRASYYYGSDDETEGSNFTYSVNFKGDVSTVTEGVEPIAAGAYQIYGDMNFYVGWSNTPEFGARDYIAQDGTHVQSDITGVDYGNLGGGFVLQYLEIPFTAKEDGDQPFEGDEVLDVTLIDEDPETGDYVTYTATIGADDLFFDKGGWGIARVGFVTEDEDGFETSIDPVLNGNVTLVISGFMQESIKAAIPMIWDNSASDDTYSGGDFGPSHGFFDVWRNGEQAVDADGYVLFTNTECIEPVISLCGYYNALCEYGTGEKTMYGEIPAEGGYAVTVVDEDGSAFNDFDIESSFPADYIEILDCPEWVESIECDDSYYEQYGILAIFISADALPAGVEGRVGNVVLMSNGEVTMNLTVTQGDVSSISNIKNDAKNTVSYNLQGQKSEATSGLMIQNGKVVFVK